MTGLLRLSTAGSVDDGKSTLIGRLLYDSKGAYEDQVASISKSGAPELALLTDGLRAEREQGITIDVAYRYFSTPRRKFIIADTPGHEQYTRNMATGASTADLAIILVDARNGVLPQSRRHAYIANLLGIRRLAVAVNKMDLAGFDQSVFEAIRAEFSEYIRQIRAAEPYFLPISALLGDNVVSSSANMPWFEGPHLLEYIENVRVDEDRDHLPARFPVQYVLRPNLDFRGYAGQLASGVMHAGDAVLALPSGRASRITRIATYDGDLTEATAGMSVTVLLEDEIDISRGDMLVPLAQPSHIGRRIEARLVWMNQKPLALDRTYLAKHTTQTVRATVNAVRYRVNIGTLAHEPAETLGLNEIGLVDLETHRPLFFDRYSENRATGAFILIDPATNETVAAGMIESAAGVPEAVRHEIAFNAEKVTPAERLARFGHRPAVVDVHDAATAEELERELFDRHCAVVILDAGLATAEALTACQAAGLIAIRIHPEAPTRKAEDIRHELETRGVIRGGEESFLGGEGI